jgi:hypothetical protein
LEIIKRLLSNYDAVGGCRTLRDDRRETLDIVYPQHAGLFDNDGQAFLGQRLCRFHVTSPPNLKPSHYILPFGCQSKGKTKGGNFA